MKIRLTLLAAVIAACGFSARADDWPLPRHDASNTAFTMQCLGPPLNLAWRVSTGRRGETLLASGGVICVGDNANPYLHRPTTLFRATDGRAVWTIPDAEPVYLHDRRLIVATHHPSGDTLDCYDWTTRQAQWSYPGARIATVAGDRVYCSLNGPAGGLAVLALSTGVELQRRAASAGGRIAIRGQTLVTAAAHWLDVLDRATLMTRVGFYDGGTTSLLYGSFAVGQGWGHWATGMDLDGRRVAWRKPAFRDVANSLVKGPDGRMLVLESTGNPVEIEALDIPTGSVIWRREMVVGGYAGGGRTAGSWNVAYVPGGHVHVPGGPRGGFYALDGATGRVLWRYEKPGVYGASVIVADGALYGLDALGNLYKFKP
jgi:hypothetical protein